MADELAERIAEALAAEWGDWGLGRAAPKAARIAADVARDWFADQLPDPEPVED